MALDGAIGGAVGGIWTHKEVHRATREPAEYLGDGRLALRANWWWWSTGGVLGVAAPLLFLALHFTRRPPEGGGTTGVVIFAGLFVLSGALLLVRAVRYRVVFDSTTIEQRTLFGRRRSLRWADLMSVTWSSLRSQLTLRGTEGVTIRIGLERGFLDFVSAVEEKVAKETRGDAVEMARHNSRSARGER